MKKALKATQTLRSGCSKAEPKKFAPPQTPFPWAQDSQNLISWRGSLPAPRHPVWWGSMHAILSYRGNRPTHKQTDKSTNKHRQGDHITLRNYYSLACSVFKSKVSSTFTTLAEATLVRQLLGNSLTDWIMRQRRETFQQQQSSQSPAHKRAHTPERRQNNPNTYKVKKKLGTTCHFTSLFTVFFLLNSCCVFILYIYYLLYWFISYFVYCVYVCILSVLLRCRYGVINE